MQHQGVLSISCGAAHGLAIGDDDQPIVDAICDGFSVEGGNKVRRKPVNGDHVSDDTILGYWRPETLVQETMLDLLADPDGNGNCVAFAELLAACFGIHGVDCDVLKILPSPPGADYDPRNSLMVHRWRDLGGGTNLPPAPWDHEMNVTVVSDTRLPAQDNDDSPDSFDAHYVVRRGALIYDPSYGSTKHPTREEHELAAFWGYAALGKRLHDQGSGADDTHYCTPDRAAQLDTRIIVQ